MKRIGIIIAFFGVYLNCSAQVLNDNPLKTQLDSTVDRSAKLYLSKAERVGISIGGTGARGILAESYRDVSK